MKAGEEVPLIEVGEKCSAIIIRRDVLTRRVVLAGGGLEIITWLTART